MKKEGSVEKKGGHKQGKGEADIRQAFVACPRCSFFIIGYDLLNKDLEQALANTNGKWLDLTWNLETRNLLHKSYGVNIRQDDSHYQGICGDCRRIFIIDEASEETGEATFKIKINPSR
jgi:hypothetical protein